MYSTEQFDEKTMARARIRNAVVSPKDSREVSAALRGKTVAQGLALLADVKVRKRAIRFTRFNQESAGHRRGMGPGRYPYKAAETFEHLLESARANAEFKDLDPELLRIVHVKADLAPRPFRFGRHRGRQGKRAHLEVIVAEDESLKKKAKKQSVSATKQKAQSKKATPKAASKDTKAEKKEAKTETAESKTSEKESKAESKDSKPETKVEPKTESKADEKPNAETKAAASSDATEQKPKAEPKESEAPKAAEESDKKGDKQ